MEGLKAVAFMSVDGRLMSAASRAKATRTSVANRYSRPLCDASKAQELVSQLHALIDQLREAATSYPEPASEFADGYETALAYCADKLDSIISNGGAA